MPTKLKKNTATKKQLVDAIASENRINPKDIHQIIQSFFDKITDTLAKGDRLEFREFGVFEVVERKKKIGRNPKNASIPIVIPARMAVKFTPGKKMDEATKRMPLE